MRANRVEDAFAADQPGFDELVGVGAVGLGAGGAAGGAPVPAGYRSEEQQPQLPIAPSANPGNRLTSDNA
jgi:hypothetical protein